MNVTGCKAGHGLVPGQGPGSRPISGPRPRPGPVIRNRSKPRPSLWKRLNSFSFRKSNLDIQYRVKILDNVKAFFLGKYATVEYKLSKLLLFHHRETNSLHDPFSKDPSFHRAV